MREEMEAIDGQEVTMPVVHPAELWQRSGRWYADRQRHGPLSRTATAATCAWP